MAGAGRVVIAGGTGFVGGEVVRTFERLGYETWVVSRQAKVNTAKNPSLLFSNKNEGLKNLTSWDNIQVSLQLSDHSSVWKGLVSGLISEGLEIIRHHFRLTASRAELWL